MRKNVLVYIAFVTVSIVATVLAIYQYNKAQQIKKEYYRVVNLHSNTKKELEEVKTSLSAFKGTSPSIVRREQDIQISERAHVPKIYFENYQSTIYDRYVYEFNGDKYEEYVFDFKEKPFKGSVAPALEKKIYGRNFYLAYGTRFPNFTSIHDFSSLKELLLKSPAPPSLEQVPKHEDGLVTNTNGIVMQRTLLDFGYSANLEYTFIGKDNVYRFVTDPVDMPESIAKGKNQLQEVRNYIATKYPPEFQELDQFIQTIEFSPY